MLLLQEAHNAIVSIVPFFAEAFRFNQAVVCVRPAQRQVLYPTPTRCDDLCIRRVLSAAIDVDTFEVAVDLAASVVAWYVSGDARVAEEVDLGAGLLRRASGCDGREGEDEACVDSFCLRYRTDFWRFIYLGSK
jgi:hypothetical protein